MRALIRVLLLALMLGVGSGAMAQGVSVTPGQDIAVNLAAEGFTTSYFIDVGPDAQQMVISFESPQGTDVDLMLRFGNAFPSGPPGLPPLFDEQLEYAHYVSVSPGPSERIAISRANRIPVQAGRWHLLLINFSDQPVTATLRADVLNDPVGAPTIEMVYNDPSCPTGSSDYWFDPGPRQNSNSNPGQTIGEQRRIAMDRAAELLANELRSAVPVRIAACWNDLGTGNAITLAQAGPRRVLRGLKTFPENHIWFAGPAAMRLAGARGCSALPGLPCNEAEIGITFNFQVDTDQALGNNRWQYVLTPQEFTGTFGPSFISVAMHEIAHGLGFLGLVNANPESNRPVGDKFNGFGDAYTRNMVIQQQDGSFMRYLDATNAERAAALTSQTRLQWDEPEAVNSVLNLLRPNNVRIFAPPSLQPGSTQSHIDQSAYGNELMRPSSTQFTQQTLGLARFMMHAVGWSPAERSDADFASVPSSLLFDPRRSGHGIDLRRVIDNVYFLLFYTFDNQGRPEWYAAVGEVVDGAFLPAENADGSSLIRLNYIPGETPPQQPDPSFSGFIRLDFNEAHNHPACNDGFPGRDRDNALAVMQFAVNSGVHTWCMESLLPDAILPDPASDLGGTWYAGEDDTGWGFSIGQFLTAEGNGLFVALYYPDAEGNPRWALAQTGNFQPGTTEPLFQIDGYCRSCERPEGNLPATQVGTIALSLVEASSTPVAGNSVQLTVTYQGPEGGTFTRTVPLQSLSAPGG
jgi:hypothetical protein